MYVLLLHLLLAFNNLSNTEYDIGLYCLRYHITGNKLRELYYCQHHNDDSKNQEAFEELVKKYGDVLIDSSSLAVFRKYIVFCGHCNAVNCHTNICCKECNYPLIRKCTKCGIYSIEEGQYTFANDKTCSHFERVSSKNSTCVSIFDVPGFITLLFSHGYGQQLVATKPSQIRSLVDYCKNSKAICSLTDENSSA